MLKIKAHVVGRLVGWLFACTMIIGDDGGDDDDGGNTKSKCHVNFCLPKQRAWGTLKDNRR